MTRWIRLRVTAHKGRRTDIFTDVGPAELRSIMGRYTSIEIVEPCDWGRYSKPRNDADRDELKEIMEILGVKHDACKKPVRKNSKT